MIRKILKITVLTLASLIVALLVYGGIQYPKTKGLNHFTAERIVHAHVDEVWDIISDVGNYHEVTAAGIDKVRILEGNGLGMKRECADPAGNSWEEVCTLWEPGVQFKFRVNTEREDYRFPFKSLSGLWRVDSIAPTSTRISLDFAYEFENPFLSGFFISAGSKQAEEDMKILLDNWQQLAEGNTIN
ncbi:hypothetical protein GWK08_13315 [Leptobacterium flavescens]|uniref:SRPBCC family protein n=1 Tax=Leptobacterium flavescens TaxID=472055 RepID=A0A6P0UN26_9FLAO|nr:SRPBCC family protein [Leptobacterium flavescens]NER14427.1 hypothetical protein [Leptobacterium flavescens]